MVPLTDEQKAYAKRTERSCPKNDKTVQNLRKQNEKKRTRVVCNRDVKQMNIGRLADESGCKRVTTPKGFSGIFQSRRIAERADA